MARAKLRTASLSGSCAALIIATGLVAVTPVAAQAAAPTNDDRKSAFEVTEFPFTTTTNTSEATAAEGDVCGSATVWYSFTPASDGTYFLTTVGSDYDTTLAVLEGDNVLDCNDDAFGTQSAVRVSLSAGTTYLIEAGTCCGPGTPGELSGGGNLQLNIQPDPPAPTVDVTLDRVAQLSRDSLRATVSGTVTCSATPFFDFTVTIEQIQGRNLSRGQVFSSGACSAEPTRWSAVMEAGSRLWSPKAATISIHASTCNFVGCAQDTASGSVKLRRS